MNIMLWIFQGVLAVVFAGSGVVKSTMSRQRLLDTGQTGIALYPMPVVRFTAICELFAAVGLLLPWWTGIAPVLTPLAALGLCVVMVGAASSHARLREPRNVAANALLFALALTVAVGRLT
jgi:hypothetical protein